MATGILYGNECGIQFAANVRFVYLTEVAASHVFADAIFCVCGRETNKICSILLGGVDK